VSLFREKHPIPRATFLPILLGPQQGSLPFRFPSQSSHRERCSTCRVPFNHISKSLVNEPSPVCPSEPPKERCPSPEPSFHNLQGSYQRSPTPGSPNTAPIARALLQQILNILSRWPSLRRSINRALWRETPVSSIS
jgi:hypothetical protein